MMRFLPSLLCAILALVSQEPQVKPEKASDRSGLEAALGFEVPPTGNMPRGWVGGPPGTIFVDDKVVHSGRWAARIERQAGSPRDFSVLTKFLEMNFSGVTVELRGFLRTEAVSDFRGAMDARGR